MGTHFKAANHPQQGYEARRARSVATMGSQVHAFRAYLHDQHYPGTVIWSLKPHHGTVERRHYRQQNITTLICTLTAYTLLYVYTFIYPFTHQST